MNTNLRWIKRRGYGVAALLVMLAGALPLLTERAAAAQVTSRSIEMSNSNNGATAVKYQVGFTAPSNATIQGIVVDFCDNDPIIGDSCTAPTGFSLSGVTVDTSTAPDTGLTGTWSVTVANSNRTLELTNATGTALNNTSVIFTISGVTNPTSDNHSFYARILTYTTTAGATGYVAGTEGSYTDYGGVALSTGKVINITAKVMETLSFCVYPDDNGGGAGTGSCGNDPSITLGHAVGSAKVIDSSAIDTAIDHFTISTNAQSGAIVRLKGDTLKSGANSIHPAGAAAVAFAAGTEDFGVRVSTLGTNITASAPYNGAAGNYGFDNSSTPNVTSTYGQQLASLSGPTNNSNTQITWAATAANTTPAGTYTAAEQLIATGTF